MLKCGFQSHQITLPQRIPSIHYRTDTDYTMVQVLCVTYGIFNVQGWDDDVTGYCRVADYQSVGSAAWPALPWYFRFPFFFMWSRHRPVRCLAPNRLVVDCKWNSCLQLERGRSGTFSSPELFFTSVSVNLTPGLQESAARKT